jgi:hypothetical protein
MFLKKKNSTKLFLAIVFLFFFVEKIQANPLRISLLTCGTGSELYSTFGHSAIRIVDSTNGADETYNYGMFNFEDPQFYWKFVRGTLLYFSAKEATEQFVYAYQIDGREVKEQVLNINPEQAQNLKFILEENNKEQNKYYRYDFLFNNCSTKLRDIFEQSFGKDLQWGQALPNDSLTFMGMLNGYLANTHWERVGIDVILSSRVHGKMNNAESMFLPEWLSKNVALATLHGKPFAQAATAMIPNVAPYVKQTNTPSIWFLGFSLLGILSSFFIKNKKLWQWLDSIWFSTLGLLGLFFIFMHFFTDHVETKHNWNMMWALPSHVAWVYLLLTNKLKKYTKIAAILLVLFIVIDVLFLTTAWEMMPIIVFTGLRLFLNSNKEKVLA